MFTSKPFSISRLRVIVGDHNRTKTEDMETVFELEQSFVHPLYEVGHSVNNDVALIKLKGGINYSRKVAPLCLPKKDVSPGTICVTVGWGDTKGEHD